MRKVLSGESLLNPALATQLLRKLAAEKDEEQAASYVPRGLQRHQSLSYGSLLTPREVDVLRLLGRGLTSRQIAQNLMVSKGTVQAHVHHIIRKLEVSDRTQAVVQAF